MRATSASGLASQSANSREPIAVTVRSITSSSEPSRRFSRSVCVISKLRRVAESISSDVPAEYRTRWSMWPSDAFCVSMR